MTYDVLRASAVALGATALISLSPLSDANAAVQHYEHVSHARVAHGYHGHVARHYAYRHARRYAYGYNAGAASVDEAKGIPDLPETRNYVDAILKTSRKRRTPASHRLDIIPWALTVAATTESRCPSRAPRKSGT